MEFGTENVGTRSSQSGHSVADADQTLDAMVRPPSRQTLQHVLGRALVALGVVSAAFLIQLTLISHVQYESNQFKATETIRFELANGTAPVGQVDSDGNLIEPGRPVAVLKIEKLGIEEVVLEGTTSSVTMSGPGHRRDTVLPGQAGISVIYGRQSAYSGVFGNLSILATGDKIETTTGQGVSTYTVTKVRKSGDVATNNLGTSKGRLTLVSTTGFPFFATDVIRVEASLDGEAKTTPNRVIPNSAIEESEKALSGDLSALTPLIFLSQFLIAAVFAVFWLARRWGPVQSWLAASPVFIFFGSVWSNYAIQLLPNLL